MSSCIFYFSDGLRGILKRAASISSSEFGKIFSELLCKYDPFSKESLMDLSSGMSLSAVFVDSSKIKNIVYGKLNSLALFIIFRWPWNRSDMFLVFKS